MTNEKRELNTSCDFIDGMKVEAEFRVDGRTEVVVAELKQVGSTWYLLQDKYLFMVIFHFFIALSGIFL